MHRSYYFPQEIEVWYILPAIRKQLALELISQGVPQKEVAVWLKLTEAAISLYKKNKRVKENIFTAALLIEIKKSAEIITRDHLKAVDEILRINELIKKEKIICRMHLQKSGLPEKNLPCAMCEVH